MNPLPFTRHEIRAMPRMPRSARRLRVGMLFLILLGCVAFDAAVFYALYLLAQWVTR